MKLKFNRDTVLLVAIVLLPFTLLRVGPVGLGEFLILIIFIFTFIEKRGTLPPSGARHFTRFWLFYLCIISFALLFRLFLFATVNSEMSPWYFDFLSFFFIALAVYAFEWRFSRRRGDVAEFIWRIYLVQFVVFAILHLLSMTFPSIMGLSLRYNGFFAPLVKNIHQTAMLFAALPFMGLYFAMEHKRSGPRTIALISAIWYVIMATQSGSVKAEMGIVFGVTALLFFFFHRLRVPGQKLAIGLAFFGLVFLVVTTQFSAISTRAIAFFVENDLHGGRTLIYTEAIKKIQEAWLLGYGPGAHIVDYSDGRLRDAHNSLLTAALQGGILGLILLVVFSVKLAKRVFGNAFLFAGLCAVSVYFIGGDILRRLPIWILLIMFAFLADRSRMIKSGVDSRGDIPR